MSRLWFDEPHGRVIAGGRGTGGGILPMEAALPRRARTHQHPAIDWRGIVADTCYFLLQLSGWLAVSLLATLGLYVLFFMALGNMSIDGFFAQLANLANRFVDADAARRDSFITVVAATSLTLFLIVAAARARSLIAVFSLSTSSAKD